MHATSSDQDITLLPVQHELRKRIIEGTYDHIVLFPSASSSRTKVAITAALALVGHQAGVSVTILCLVTSDAGRLDRANIWSQKPMVILKQTVNTSETTFPLCSFGSPGHHHATLWSTSEPVRSCVVGTSQVKGQDYFESFASGARGTSVKMCVIVTVVNGWIDFHFDLNGAYLDSNIDTDVYVDQAAGLDPVVGPNGERMCMKLDKAIYGTVQAARLFTKKFRAALVSIGFEVSLDDEAVYRLDHKLGRIILSTHVDDGIGGASTTAVRDWMYAEIIKKGFSFSQQGGWHTILGFGATRDLVNRTVTISAGGHIRDLVRLHLADEVASTLNPPTPTARTIMDLQPAGIETPAESSLHVAWRSDARSRPECRDVQRIRNTERHREAPRETLPAPGWYTVHGEALRYRWLPRVTPHIVGWRYKT